MIRMLSVSAAVVFCLSANVLGQHTPLNGGVRWQQDVEAGLQTANDSGQLILMKFTADSCVYCKKMERDTFSNPQIGTVVHRSFVPVLVDATKYRSLVEQLKIKGLPTTLVVSPDMVILERILGYRSAESLLPELRRIEAEHAPKTAPAATPRTSHSPVVAQTPVVAEAPTTRPTGTSATPAVKPVGYDGPAFGGLCLSGVRETRSLVSGRPQFACRYRGRLLHFSSDQQMEKFMAAPAKYWPAGDGTCPVTLAKTGRVVEGKLVYAAMYQGKLWLMKDRDTMKTFVASPATYVK